MAVPELWRTTQQRYNLRAEVCPHCEEAVFPPRAVCPYCRREMRVRIRMTTPAIAAPMAREFIYAMATPGHTVTNHSITSNVIIAGDD